MMKIKELIDSIKLKLKYSRCYDSNEDTGKAVFGLCRCDDKACPYNVNHEKDKEMGLPILTTHNNQI